MLVMPISSDRGVVTEHVDDYLFDVREEGAQTLDTRITIPGQRVIIREDTNQVLGTVRSNYQVLSHREALEPLLTELSKHATVFKRIMLTDNGAKMFANLYIKDEQLDVADGDAIWPGVTIVNALDGSLKYICEASIFRLVCTNGLRIPQVIAAFNMIHTKSANWSKVAEDLLEYVSSSDEYSIITKLANTPVDDQDALKLIQTTIETKAFPKRYQPAIVSELETERSQYGLLTLWSVYNAFNSVLEHSLIREKGKFERARLLDKGLYQAFTLALKDYSN